MPHLFDYYSSMLCPLPWYHLYIDEKGHFYPCCFSDKSQGSFRDLNNNQIHADDPACLEKFWESPDRKKMQTEMTKNKIPAYCKGCSETEKKGVKSCRNRSLERIPVTLNSIDNTPEALISIDLRLGNTCDLACRMCSPTSSIQLYKPYMEFYQHSDPSLKNIDWFEKDHFWSQILKYGHDLVFIHLAGGEPFRCIAHPIFLNKLNTIRATGEIFLSYNTNLNHIPDYAKEIWKKYKAVDLTISIDGVGKVNDYIRYPSKWEELLKNINEIDSNPSNYNVESSAIHSVVQIYNIFDLGNLVDFCNSFKSISSYPIFDFVIGDPALDIQILPHHLKMKMANNLNSLISKLGREKGIDSGRNNLINQLHAIKNHLINKDLSGHIPRFKEMTQIFDKHYNQKLEDYIPELKELIILSP